MPSQIPKLLIRSLDILGLQQYLSTLRKDTTICPGRPSLTVTNLNPACFDATNEKTLLILIHFLLCLIDPTFRSKCASIWPYQGTHDKNEFKVKAQENLSKLISLNILDHSDCRASILTVAKGIIIYFWISHHLWLLAANAFPSIHFYGYVGYSVWLLLWKLSNAALESYLLSESVPLQSLSQSEAFQIKSLADNVRNCTKYFFKILVMTLLMFYRKLPPWMMN